MIIEAGNSDILKEEHKTVILSPFPLLLEISIEQDIFKSMVFKSMVV